MSEVLARMHAKAEGGGQGRYERSWVRDLVESHLVSEVLAHMHAKAEGGGRLLLIQWPMGLACLTWGLVGK